jgi:hypothetical protein
MAVDVTMPRLSDSMTEAVIVAWLKRDGERVERGEETVEIETDKATTTYAADSDGFLAIVAREGETLPVGADDRPASLRARRVDRRQADTRLQSRTFLIGVQARARRFRRTRTRSRCRQSCPASTRPRLRGGWQASAGSTSRR